MKALSIHGYHGSPQNAAATALTAQGVAVTAPAIDYDSIEPEAFFETLCGIAQKEQTDLLAGTSYGGFFAACLAAELSLPVILVNPCLLPFYDLPQLGFTGDIRPLMRLFPKLAALRSEQISCIIGAQDEVLRSQAFTIQLTQNERFRCIPDGKHGGYTLPLDTYFREILPQIGRQA